MKLLRNLLCLVSVLFLVMTSPALAQTTRGSLDNLAMSPTIKVLSKEVSRSLRITRIPTSKPTPLIVGNYWNCREQSSFEICRLTVVVCTNDQDTCVEIPSG